MSTSPGWMSSLLAVKKAGPFIIVLIVFFLFLEVSYLFGERPILFFFLLLSLMVFLLSGFRAWSTHRDAEAFTNRPYTANRDDYTFMRHVMYGHLRWSEAEKTWNGSVWSFSFFGGHHLILTLWCDGNGRFLEAETAEGRWLGRYKGRTLRISLTTSLQPWVKVRGNDLEVSSGQTCKFEVARRGDEPQYSLWLTGDMSQKLPSRAAKYQLITFTLRRGEGLIKPEATSLQELPVLMIVAASRFVKEIYFTPDPDTPLDI